MNPPYGRQPVETPVAGGDDDAEAHVSPGGWTFAAHDQPLDLAGCVAALTRVFRSAGLDTPGLDARRLVAGLLGLDDAVLLGDPERALRHADICLIEHGVRRRLAREPVSRILGYRQFHGLDFEIGPATLDPRPDTETLVDGVLELVGKGLIPGGRSPRILDLGTGSGAILLALLKALPEARGVGIDISDVALAIAQRNAERHDLARRARFLVSNWFASVSGSFDLVVSNPPYIARADIAGLAPEVRSFDPPAALDGGETGFAAFSAIAAGLGMVLVPGGWIAVEVGAGQAEVVANLLTRECHGIELIFQSYWTDLAGMQRCVAMKARTS